MHILGLSEVHLQKTMHLTLHNPRCNDMLTSIMCFQWQAKKKYSLHSLWQVKKKTAQATLFCGIITTTITEMDGTEV